MFENFRISFIILIIVSLHDQNHQFEVKKIITDLYDDWFLNIRFNLRYKLGAGQNR